MENQHHEEKWTKCNKTEDATTKRITLDKQVFVFFLKG